MSSVPTITVHDYEPATATMRDDVLAGLAQRPKSLPSQYLYDERGAELFERICDTDEYYLTRTELGILQRHMPSIAERIGSDALVIEPGSGSGIKTRLLLEQLEQPAGYVPIDVAKQQLTAFAADIDQAFPNLDVLPVCADFTGDYDVPDCEQATGKRVAFFPGSTIGNFVPEQALVVLRRLAALCEGDGGLLIGIDLKKDPDLIESAYDDQAGVSREFALNYLVRLNRELGAAFALDQFHYEAPYNEPLGRIEMALISLRNQTVRVDGATVEFADQERVRTEVSHKYTPDEFAGLAAQAGLQVEQTWTDPQRLFSVQYLSRNQRSAPAG